MKIEYHGLNACVTASLGEELTQLITSSEHSNTNLLKKLQFEHCHAHFDVFTQQHEDRTVYVVFLDDDDVQTHVDKASRVVIRSTEFPTAQVVINIDFDESILDTIIDWHAGNIENLSIEQFAENALQIV